jgi:hypothetical protein
MLPCYKHVASLFAPWYVTFFKVLSKVPPHLQTSLRNKEVLTTCYNSEPSQAELENIEREHETIGNSHPFYKPYLWILFVHTRDPFQAYKFSVFILSTFEYGI